MAPLLIAFAFVAVCGVCVWQGTGALSIAMLLIQAPGNILVVCFQVRFNIYGLLPKPGTD
jgi:hypothetical protein